MSNINIAYGTSTAMVITLDALAGGAARESTAVDNSVNKFADAIVQGMVSVNAVGGNEIIKIYVYGSEDGTRFTDNATGINAAITPRSPTALVLAQTIPIPTP